MRPIDIDNDEFQDLDEFEDVDKYGRSGVESIRRVTNKRRSLEQRLEGRKRPGHARKDPWDRDCRFQYDDYDEDEFDRFSGVNVGHH